MLVRNELKLSNYNCVYSDEQNVIIYNTRIGSLVQLSADEYEKLLSNEFDDEFLEKLYLLGIVVDKDFDEYEFVLNKLKLNIEKKRDPIFRILPTTRCNARCFYCYEHGMKQEDMTSETVAQTIEYIKNKTIDHKTININWFGGEPLLRFDIMEKISNRLITYCEETNKSFCASLITNGSLFDNDKIARVDSLCLKTIQITLDGTNLEYCKRKNYYDKNINLETILSNIESILKNSKARVHVRLNFDKNNFEDTKVLIKQLKERFYGFKKLGIYAYPLFATHASKNPHIISIENANEYFEELISLLNGNKNTLFLLPRPKSTNCFVYNESSCVISSNGDILKCTNAPNSVLGHLTENNISQPLNYQWKTLCISSSCRECKLFPVCLGGCKAKILNNEEYCCVHKNLMNIYLKNIIRGRK